MGERTQELINQIGGERGNLAPGSKEERGEAAAIKELGARLGMTGFESGDNDKELRLEKARVAGQDPVRFFREEVNRLDIDANKLTEQLQDIEGEQLVVYPKRGEDFVAASERIAADKKNRAETVRNRLEQLDFDRSRVDEISRSLEDGQTESALYDLEERINRAERALVGLDRRPTDAVDDKNIKAEKDRRSQELRNLRAMVKNLELYKK